MAWFLLAWDLPSSRQRQTHQKSLLGKAVTRSFLPPAWKGCPGPGTLPYKERKSPTACTSHTSLFWNIFPCSRFDVYFFCSAWACGSLALRHVPTFLNFKPICGKGCPLPAAEKGFMHHLPVLLWAVEWDPLTTGDGCWLLKLLLLCLFMGGKALFHPEPV